MQHHVIAQPNIINVSSRADPLPVLWRRLPPLDTGLVVAWQQWADGPHGRRHRRRWVERAPLSARWSAHDLAHPRSGPATNELQQVLVVDAQQSRVAAALTLLVQLRPGLVRLARSAAGWNWYHGFDAAEETQATFFEVLYNLDLERRGRAVAANLVLDTRQRLWRQCPAGRRRTDGPPAGPPLPGLGLDPGEPTGRDSTGRDSTADPVVAVVDLQRHLAALPGSPASRQLSTDIAHRAWFRDQPSRLIAAELGLRRHTVDSRLYRIRESMRESMRDAVSQ